MERTGRLPLKRLPQLNKLSLNNLIRHRTKPVTVADVHLPHLTLTIHRLGLPEGQYTQYYFFEESYFDELGSFSLGEQIYYRLKDKEEIMLNAIETQVLEEVTSTEEDLEIIFNGLGL